MTRTVIAHLTDAHLGQKLTMGAEMAGTKMRYLDEPREHEDHLRIVLDDIAGKGISDVVFGGDIGTQESVGGFFEILGGYDFKVSIILGNHDTYPNVVQHCRMDDGAVEGKMCFSHNNGHLKRIFLDSSDNVLGDDQRAWLARELDGVSKAALFVHHPVLAIDTPLEQAGVALRDRDEVKTLLLSRTDCELSVFCGHYHMIDEVRQANISQFATPAVSYQIIRHSDPLRVDTDAFGYRIVEIDDARIRTEVVMLTST